MTASADWDSGRRRGVVIPGAPQGRQEQQREGARTRRSWRDKLQRHRIGICSRTKRAGLGGGTA